MSGKSFYNGNDPTWPWPDECYVYLIGEPEAKSRRAFVKVGISYNPLGRLKNIQTSCPISVEIILEFWMPTKSVALAVEKEFHASNCPARTSGEWFFMNAGDAVKGIEAIAEPYLAAFD